MEENEVYNFSWSLLFTVTACSSFLFSGILKLLDGDFSGILLIIGIVATFFGLINWIGRRTDRQNNNKRKNPLIT